MTVPTPSLTLLPGSAESLRPVCSTRRDATSARSPGHVRPWDAISEGIALETLQMHFDHDVARAWIGDHPPLAAHALVALGSTVTAR
jgi:hypothetical protein